MKKNLPYFLVIAALIFLIIGVLSSGKERTPSITPVVEQSLLESKEIAKEVQIEEPEAPFSFSTESTPVEAAQEQRPVFKSLDKIFNVYTDKRAPDNHFAPSGWMGDFGDVSLNDQYMKEPHSGSTSIQISYSAERSQGAGWAGMFWQNPPNNWGEKMGGFDLTGYNKLTFWARGENGGEAIEKVKVGGIKGTYPDSLEVGIGPLVLSNEWKEYSINLVDQDLSYVSGGFCWISASRLNPNGATFYFDDIRFEYDPYLQPQVENTPEEMPFNVYTERSSVFNHFIPSGWMGDYSDLKIDEAWTADPHSGVTCLRVVYSGKVSQGARWAGMFWQNPPNNWGQVKDAGFDLSQARKLTFWARGENGGERIEEFKMGGISGDYGDSDTAGIGPVMLTPEWKQYTIDLSGKDLSYIIGGFCFSTNVDVNPEGCIFYLDDIKYE
ncbi:MAG: hypothetical protein JSV30_06270 [Candidatus Omnitrophota bacterium]|nr:MAG: hypothetical protein JSV30_06270 [Candidatus Omnitrophota bacterium]